MKLRFSAVCCANLRKICLNWPQHNTYTFKNLKLWKICNREHRIYIYLYQLRGFFSLKVIIFISNCYGNENLLKLPRGEVYHMLIVKTEKKLGRLWVRFEDMTSAICHLSPHMAPSWSFYELQEQSQLLNRYWIF